VLVKGSRYKWVRRKETNEIAWTRLGYSWEKASVEKALDKRGDTLVLRTRWATDLFIRIFIHVPLSTECTSHHFKIVFGSIKAMTHLYLSYWTPVYQRQVRRCSIHSRYVQGDSTSP
jgi:hypothetical protein